MYCIVAHLYIIITFPQLISKKMNTNKHIETIFSKPLLTQIYIFLGFIKIYDLFNNSLTQGLLSICFGTLALGFTHVAIHKNTVKHIEKLILLAYLVFLFHIYRICNIDI